MLILLLIAYIMSLVLIATYALHRRQNPYVPSRFRKIDRVDKIIPSNAPIDVMLPQEIIIEIIKYDFSVAVRCREVSKYWRSLISDQGWALVRSHFNHGRDLFISLVKSVANDETSNSMFPESYHFDSAKAIWTSNKVPIFLTPELVRNICAAEKSGKYFIEIKSSSDLAILRALDVRNSIHEFDKFIVQTTGELTCELIGRQIYKNCISLYLQQQSYLLRKPESMPMPRLGSSPVKLTFNLGEFLNSIPEALTLRDPIYRLPLIEWQVKDPLIWTLGIFANSTEILGPLVSLLILPWICSLITPVLPLWNTYSTIITILAVFLTTSNKDNRSILLFEAAVAFWLIFTIGSCHWINTTNIIYVPIYEAIGNFIWTVVYYSYVEFGTRYLKDQKLDLTRKIFSITSVVITIYASVVLSNSMQDSILSFNKKVILLWYNIKYLCGAFIYLLLTYRIFGVKLRDLLRQITAASIGSFAAKVALAIILRLVYQ